MFLLYLTVCYIHILQSTSYVLLAANIDDFRSLAKRFAPEHLTDELLAQRESKGDEPPSEEAVIPNPMTEEEVEEVEDSDKKTYEPVKKVYFKNKPNPSSVFEMNLDDLVERVKEKLRKELTIMATQKNIPKSSTVETTTANTNNAYDTQDEYEPTTKKKQQARYVQKNRHNKNEKVNKRERKIETLETTDSTDRYTNLDKYDETEPPDSAVQPQAPVRPKNPIRNKKVRIITTEPKLKPTTEEPNTITETGLDNLFHGIDLVQVHDSYEDYVTPKKDEDYSETDPPKYNREAEVSPNDYYASTTPESTNAQYEEETTTYKNKYEVEEMREGTESTVKQREQPPMLQLQLSKNKMVNNPLDPVLTYAQQIASIQLVTPEDYEDETTTVSPEDVEARTESIGDQQVTQATVKPNANPNFSNKFGLKHKKPTKGTGIPKRDFYKFSSPNYLKQLPTVAEKYKFDEPIPEKDREPEILKNIGNPPASINGKVILL